MTHSGLHPVIVSGLGIKPGSHLKHIKTDPVFDLQYLKNFDFEVDVDFDVDFDFRKTSKVRLLYYSHIFKPCSFFAKAMQAFLSEPADCIIKWVNHAGGSPSTWRRIAWIGFGHTTLPWTHFAIRTIWVTKTFWCTTCYGIRHWNQAFVTPVVNSSSLDGK